MYRQFGTVEVCQLGILAEIVDFIFGVFTVFSNLCPNKGGGHYLCDGFTAKISPLRRPRAHSYLGLELWWLLKVVFKLFKFCSFFQYVFYGCKYSKTYLPAFLPSLKTPIQCSAVAPVLHLLLGIRQLLSTKRN